MDEEMFMELLLSGMLPQIAGPAAGKDWTTSEQGKAGNVAQDWMQMLFSPQFGALAAMSGITGGLDYMQLAEPMPEPQTPLMDIYSNSQDPFEQELAQMMRDPGTSPATIRQAIRTAFPGEENQQIADDYIKDAEAAFGEYTKAQSEYAKNPKLSPVEEMYRKAGLPLPTEKYTPEQMPGMDQRRHQQRVDEYGRQVDAAQVKGNDLQALLESRRAAMPKYEGPDVSAEAQGGGGIAGSFNRLGASLNNLVPTALGGPGFNPTQITGDMPDITNTSQYLGDLIAGRAYNPNGNGPTAAGSQPAAGSNVTAGNSGALNRQLESRVVDHAAMKKELARRQAEMGRQNDVYKTARSNIKAAKGQTPTTDALAARRMLLQAMGVA